MKNNDNLNQLIFNGQDNSNHRNMIILNENIIITCNNVREEENIKNYLNDGFLASNNINSMKGGMASTYPLVDKCIRIDDTELWKSWVCGDNINTSKSNILFNEMISGNSDMTFICVIWVAIISVIFLLYKLLYSDERFSRESKCSSSIDIESLIKGGLVFKSGYDCDNCCCGDSCHCCCGHSSAEYWARAEERWAAEAAAIKAQIKAARAREAEERERQTNQENREADVPLAWGLYFQDGASPSFEGIVDLHNRIMFYLVVILFGVTWVMASIMHNFNKNENKLVYRYLNHGTLIELIWTVGPALVLVAIAFPSFKLLYLMDNKLCPFFVFTNKKNSKICKNL